MSEKFLDIILILMKLWFNNKCSVLKNYLVYVDREEKQQIEQLKYVKTVDIIGNYYRKNNLFDCFFIIF